jgi:hypothetical protein
VINGSAIEGQLLSVAHGIWTNAPSTYTYEWFRCDAGGGNCDVVLGAIGPIYLLGAGDVGSTIRVQEVASSQYGSGTPVFSVATATIVGAPPTNSSLPGIASDVIVGRVLSAAHGTWTNVPTGFAEQWLRCNGAGDGCVPIAGATGLAYGLTAADVGSTLRVEETASNAYGSSIPAASANTGLIQPFPVASIAGSASALVGVTVSYQTSVIDSAGSPTSFVWTVDGHSAGSGATLTYRFTRAGHHSIYVQVSDTAGNVLSAALTVTATFRRLKINLVWSSKTFSEFSAFTSLIARAVPIGTDIGLTCAGGGCPYARRSFSVTASSRCKRNGCRKKKPALPVRDVNLLGDLQGRHLPFGTKLTIKLTRRLYVGEVQVFTIGPRGPRQQTQCLAPGASKPGRGC